MESKGKLVRPARQSFDVNCVVGTVYLDDNSGNFPTPTHAAMSLIVDAGPGEYTFPRPEGGIFRVEFHEEGELA